MNALAQRAGARPKPKAGVIHGEASTGYEDGQLGEFECENCSFFDADSSSCGQPTMMAKSKQPKLDSGRVEVDPEGCCEFVDRIGKVEEHEAEELSE